MADYGAYDIELDWCVNGHRTIHCTSNCKEKNKVEIIDNEIILKLIKSEKYKYTHKDIVYPDIGPDPFIVYRKEVRSVIENPVPFLLEEIERLRGKKIL